MERRLGLAPGDLDGAAEVAVWPDNWPAIRVFAALQTQWHVAPNGRLLGLRYAALVGPLWRLCGIGRKRRPALMADLQVMERSLLAADCAHGDER